MGRKTDGEESGKREDEKREGCGEGFLFRSTSKSSEDPGLSCHSWASVSHSAKRYYTDEKFLYPKVSGLTHPQGQAGGWTLAPQGAKDRAILVGQGFVGLSETLG